MGWVFAMGETPFDVHINFRRGDREIAASLARRLEALGVTCQYDAGIGGERLIPTDAGAQQAGMLVVIVSAEPPDGRNLRRELAAADRLQRPVAALLVEDIEPRGQHLQLLADRIWFRLYPDPIAQLDHVVELLAALSGKGVASAPKAEPQTLEARQQSLDEAIGEMLSSAVDPAGRAPTDRQAYVGRANSGGKPAPRRGGAGAAIANVLTLGIAGVMARGRAKKAFRANLRKV
ncbi:MAG: hypothetical protein B7Y90_10895 [Alphaproteobacteria bacterium 32-64-14]|nr:MAG: hypothetical protein B7Y90_10895 [Alphaproteobacteria bacterium 32-64-14]